MPETKKKMIRVLVIWANGKMQDKEIGDDYESLRNEVGGMLEHLDMGYSGFPNLNGVHAWFNEEGKMLDLPVNIQATSLCHLAKMIAFMDCIVGPFVLTGSSPDGDTTSCPSMFIDFVKETFTLNFK